jgi:ABC-type transport system substrate-binding protein/serine/threonine protein kinase
VRLSLQAAIKVLHTHLTGSEAEHFYQEAETIAKLSHPSIIRISDFDVQDGTPFLVMDYAQGGSLRQRYPRGSLVPLPQIVSYVKQMSAALQYAHDKRFIHRDVKPENMLIGQHQEILLSDFGIATMAQSTSSLDASTQGTSGTLAYMAPEQIEGQPRPASDQYALGIVAYEWLCGEQPFEGSVSELIAQQLSMPPLPLHERMPAIPAEVEQVVLRTLAKDPKARFASVAAFSKALEQASQRAISPTAQQALEQAALSPAAEARYERVAVAPDQPVLPTETMPSAELPVGALEPTIYPDSSSPPGLDTPPSETPQSSQVLAPTVAVISPPLEPTMPIQRKARRLPRTRAILFIGLMIVVIAASFLASLSLLAHFGVIGTSSATAPVHGGTWITDFSHDPGSLIPDTSYEPWSVMAQQALYLPLFYGDAHGEVHPGAATEIPTVQNGGISADATTWTFHLRPHLMWSDGQPYDARDVAYTWKLILNPSFYYNGSVPGLDPTSTAVVSSNHLSITFHLKQPYAPFLALWIDGFNAPLPAHYFNSLTPKAILQSTDFLNPQVVSGPFMMSESVLGDHYTLVRNPRYYLASEGLPYLNKVIIRITPTPASLLKDLQTGSIDSYDDINSQQVSANPQVFEHLNHYRIVSSPSSTNFLGLFFNFKNIVLASHIEVREAMAMAIDHQTMIATVVHGFAENICTDHGSFYHPGYEPNYDCPPFDPTAANKLLSDNGWVRGQDGVRAKGKQRLEFELSSVDYAPIRVANEVIVQHDLSAIGIKLDIQNYGGATFFGSFLYQGKPSPPTGAVAGRNDIAEFAQSPYTYDPDDSYIIPCNQYPYYCNSDLSNLYKQELETADAGQRQQIFSQIHQIYLTDFPFIPLYFPLDVSIAHKGTHNNQPSPFTGETVKIWQWWCDHGKC